jgi:YD repeat-containing protein
MHTMKKTAIVLLMLAWPMLMLGQDKKAVAGKLKSITVHEQKYEKGVAGKANVESVVRYDEAGNIIEEIEYKLGRVDKHFTYKYNDANNKVEEVELDPSGRKIKVTEYKYNSANLRTEKTVYDGKNQILSKKTYKYETY